MTALAEFHQAVSSFPLAEPAQCPSPGIAERLAQLRSLLDGEFEHLRVLVQSARDGYQPWAAQIIELFPRAAPQVVTALERASRVEVSAFLACEISGTRTCSSRGTPSAD